jgi:hypothetical protein
MLSRLPTSVSTLRTRQAWVAAKVRALATGTPLAVPNGSTAVLAPIVVANPLPVIASYRWSKAPLGSGTFVNVTDANGGNQPTLTVTSNVAAPTGPGIYRLTVTNAATPTPGTAVTVNCTVTVAP